MPWFSLAASLITHIAVNIPVAATDGNLEAAVSDFRAEVRDKALHLYVMYNFRGSPRPMSPTK
ncbi:MAG: hypothetical protein AB7F88_10715 [Pyrinomonadaceae bacterium]